MTAVTAAAPPSGEASDAPVATAAERAWCRDALTRVSRTFAINIRMLPGSLEPPVRNAYLLCRIADTIEDAWPGDAGELGRRFDQLLAALHGDLAAGIALAAASDVLRDRASDAHRDLVAHTPVVLRSLAGLRDIDREGIVSTVETLASGMRRYAVRDAERRAAGLGATLAYLDDEAELDDYCWVVAGCIGPMLSTLYASHTRDDGGRSAARLALAPTVGEALQLTNILLDWPSDIGRGRCFVPSAWLAEHGLVVPDLVAGGDQPMPGVVAIASRLERRARAALDQVPNYIGTIPSRSVRFRMFCLLPALWALGSLRHARRDPRFPWGSARPKLPRAEVRRIAAAGLMRGHTRGGIEAIYRSLGADPTRSSTTSSTRPGSAV